MTPTFAFILGFFSMSALVVLLFMADEFFETHSKIKIHHFHIGFKYEELIPCPDRYLNRGEVWVERVYDFDSPRLFKIQQLIDEGKVRFPK